ncbi:hypothetical protein HUJ04_004591 [Dendroctonus ponderosae]|nr:hypothetical protein HUJ04_004591 [Dendroctonus ponderosae]
MLTLLENASKRRPYPIGKVNGALANCALDDPQVDSSSESEDLSDYEQEFVKAELKKYAKGPSVQTSGFGEDVSSIGDLVPCLSPQGKSDPAEVYQKHNFTVSSDMKPDLPIDSQRSQILSRIDLNQVIVIQGATGCGKTTQVPQMIMDDLRLKNEYCNIVVTQPRKIATINVAKRVCEERGWTLGTVCGYQVALEKKISENQIITYMTIGILLQKLIRKGSLREYTHIIIDEVHERNQELDFLLLIVRKFLFSERGDSFNTKACRYQTFVNYYLELTRLLQVILMSATINAEDFAHYFRRQVAGQIISAPILKVNKPSQYTKTVFYLDQISVFRGEMAKFDIGKPEIPAATWREFAFLVRVFDKMSSNIDGDDNVNFGSVLVFLPGINEIEEAHKLLLQEGQLADPHSTVKRLKWDIIPLHSSLPNDEQAQAFKRPKPGYRKIILSTNIAESSVTVPDTCYVIDFCLTKVMTVDPVTKYMSLKLEWASHVNCEQRAGRVGRTCDGRIYRLVSKEFYSVEMQRTSLPEILRAPLERTVLQAKMLGLSETPAQTLALALNPPNLKNIQSTLWHLKEIGAMLRTCRGISSTSDGDITFMGQLMASLPVDVHLSKLIILGQLFSCLDETVVIAAGCSIQNIFSIPYQKRLEAYRKILLWADGSCSDLIALLNLYTVWQTKTRDNSFGSRNSELEWCKRNLVNLKGLREWKLLVTEIHQRLERLQIRETAGPGKINLTRTEKPTVLKVIMAGAFYPNFFIKPANGELESEREAVKTVAGRCPFNTVYLSGLDPKQPGHIYVRQIKRLVQDLDDKADVHIGFDGSTKIFVEFKSNSGEPLPVNVDGFSGLACAPGRIPRPVYEAIRRRQLKYNFQLKLLPPKQAWDFAERHKAHSTNSAPIEVTPNCFSTIEYTALPASCTQFIQLHIAAYIDAGHFWAQNADDRTNELLQQIEEALNKQVLKKVDEPLKIGKVYATRFRQDGLFYRCRLTASAGRSNEVLFIDYGNMQEALAEELFYLPQRPQCFIPPLAYECIMHGIKPAYRHNPLGVWHEKVNGHFRRWSNGILLYGEVYSVVNEVVELDLYRNPIKDLSLNDYLIREGFADKSSPSYLSKCDHDRRLQIQSAHNPSEEAQRLDGVEKIISFSDFVDPNVSASDAIIAPLRGPFSPLEASVYGCISMSNSKSVKIDGSSINTVLLDTEPESRHGRLLVAASVGQSVDGTSLRLRQTTLMPNVPGLPMMLAATFCPNMEPKVTADNSLVGAILCGMGCHETTNKPLYSVHDMLIHLDTELKIEELEMINKLRYLMNNGIRTMQEMELNTPRHDDMLAIQINIKDHLFSLLNMERSPIDRQVAPCHSSWGTPGGLGQLKPNLDNDDQDIWGLLWFVKVADIGERDKDVLKNLEDMDHIVFGLRPFEAIACLLCEAEFLFINDLRLHMITAMHKNEVSRFRDRLEPEDYDDDEEEQ